MNMISRIAVIAALLVSGVRSTQAGLLVCLETVGLAEGVLDAWPNTGTLGGSFVNKSATGRGRATTPVIETVAGRKAVTFDGAARLQSDVLAPASLGGPHPFTIAAWAYNPSVETNENIVSWCDRYTSTPEGQYGAFGWGSANSGAYYRYGADLGYSEVPSAGQWHHIALIFSGGGGIFRVYVDGSPDSSLDVTDHEAALQSGYPITLGAMRWSNNSQEWFDPFSGSVASVQTYDHELSSADIADLNGPALLVDLDASRLRFGPLDLWANRGQLGGSFSSQGARPSVEIVGGHRAVTFDGGGMRSDFVAPTSLGGTHPFTIAVWAYNPQIAANEAIVNWCDRATSDEDGQYSTLGWGTNASEGTAYFGAGEDLAYRHVPSPGAWHHIAVTYSGTASGALKVYVDGQRDNTQTVTAPNFQTQHSRPFTLGALQWSGHSPEWLHPFTGSLASVKVYNYALNQEAIAELAGDARVADLGPTDGPGVNVTLFVVSDLHYGVGGEEATRATIDLMNGLPGAAYPESVGGPVNYPEVVVATGDLTQDGLQAEWDMFVADFGLTGQEGRLHYAVYDGWGNHDQHPGNTSPVTEGIKERNLLRPGLTNVSSNGYHYSWDSDGVHFVMLNEYGGTGSGDPNSWGAPMDSLPFLVSDLKAHVGASRKGVVIFTHFAFDNWGLSNWKPWEQDAFFQAIKDYNILALIGGHGHAVLTGRWNGLDYYEVASTQPVSDDNGFSVVHITQDTLTIASRLNVSDTWGKVYQKDIDLPEPESASVTSGSSVQVDAPSTR